MTREQATHIRDEYNRHDEAFRAAKKRGDHRKASEHKARRDALDSALGEALKVLRGAK